MRSSSSSTTVRRTGAGSASWDIERSGRANDDRHIRRLSALARSLWLFVGAVLTNLLSLSQLWFGDARFKVGDAAVGEPVVLAGGGQFVGEAADLRRLVANGALEGEVLGSHADA